MRPFKRRVVFEFSFKPEHWVAGISINDILNHGLSTELYINEFRRYKKNRVFHYWLNIVKENAVFKNNKPHFTTYQRAENPNFIFRKMTKVRDDKEWLDSGGVVLLQSYRKIKDLLPTSKETAVTYNEIKKMISNPTFYRDLKEKHNTITIKEFKRKHPVEYTQFLKEQKIKIFLDKEYSKINEKLKKNNDKEVSKLKSKIKKKYQITNLDF